MAALFHLFSSLVVALEIGQWHRYVKSVHSFPDFSIFAMTQDGFRLVEGATPQGTRDNHPLLGDTSHAQLFLLAIRCRPLSFGNFQLYFLVVFRCSASWRV